MVFDEPDRIKPWQKLAIGIAIAILVIASLGVFGILRFRHFLYPAAPPMPAVVDQSMPEILARLEGILTTNAPHVIASLQPGLPAAEISKLETQYHVQLPDDIKAIYEWHNGSASNTNRLVAFIPIHRFVPLEEALQDHASMAPEKASFLQRVVYLVLESQRESWICLFDDGAGDGYWFDLNRKPAEGAVFSNFTEEASYVFFPSPKNLMAGITECYEQGAFHVKKDSSPPDLDEDFDQTQKIWNRFGASK